MCSVVTIVLECLVWVLLCKEVGSSLVFFAITERSDMGPYLCLCWVLGLGIMLDNFHLCDIMLILRTVFNMLVRTASPIRVYVFKCLMFSLLGHCELLFLLCYMVYWT